MRLAELDGHWAQARDWGRQLYERYKDPWGITHAARASFLIGESDASVSSHTVTVIEAEIDDMNPQIFGVVMEQLLAEGALDVFYTPIQMKKNRPGTLLSVIATPATRERLTSVRMKDARSSLTRGPPTARWRN